MAARGSGAGRSAFIVPRVGLEVEFLHLFYRYIDTSELFLYSAVHEVGAAPTEREGLSNAWEMDGIDPLAFPVYKTPEQHAVALDCGGLFDCDEVPCDGDLAPDEFGERP